MKDVIQVFSCIAIHVSSHNVWCNCIEVASPWRCEDWGCSLRWHCYNLTPRGALTHRVLLCAFVSDHAMQVQVHHHSNPLEHHIHLHSIFEMVSNCVCHTFPWDCGREIAHSPDTSVLLFPSPILVPHKVRGLDARCKTISPNSNPKSN